MPVAVGTGSVGEILLSVLVSVLVSVVIDATMVVVVVVVGKGRNDKGKVGTGVILDVLGSIGPGPRRGPLPIDGVSRRRAITSYRYGRGVHNVGRSWNNEKGSKKGNNGYIQALKISVDNWSAGSVHAE